MLDRVLKLACSLQTRPHDSSDKMCSDLDRIKFQSARFIQATFRGATAREPRSINLTPELETGLLRILSLIQTTCVLYYLLKDGIM